MLRINFIVETSSKSHEKKIKYYPISKNYFKVAADYLSRITQLLQMSINEIMMLLCQTMLLRQNIDKFLLRNKEIYHRIPTSMN